MLNFGSKLPMYYSQIFVWKEKKITIFLLTFWKPQTEEDSQKPKATRHLILIRHGQYNLKGKTDPERYLSDLGREQAVLTGHYFSEHEIQGPPWQNGYFKLTQTVSKMFLMKKKIYFSTNKKYIYLIICF